jgi:hypothetical protein
MYFYQQLNVAFFCYLKKYILYLSVDETYPTAKINCLISLLMQEKIKTMKQYYRPEKLRVFFLSMLAAFAFVFQGNAQGSVTLNAGSSGTWVVPCGVTEIVVQAWGGGGGGGLATNNNRGGSGGGGGGYSFASFSVTGGDLFLYSVGLGGQGATPFFPTAGNGTSTIFGPMSTGFGGGGGNTCGGGGSGGLASGGDINEPGEDGALGDCTNGGSSGKGGDSPLGGNGGASLSVPGNGSPGGFPGGGGSGGWKTNAIGTPNGGNGGNGAVIISWDIPPFPAGLGQLLNECVNTTQLDAIPVPAGFEGTWSVTPAGPSFSNPNAPDAVVTNLALNTAYTFRWTVTSTSGGCPPVFDEIIVVTQSMPVDAGFDQNRCQENFTMQANNPAPFTGNWTQISGPAVTITNPTSPNATVGVLAQGTCVTLRWTITDPISGCIGFDDVVICRPAAGAACNDDPCSADPVPINGCATTGLTLNGATVTQNPGEPGCGYNTFYTADNRIDIWYTATTDANGNLNLNLTGGTYLNAAIYTGTCNNLSLFSCHGWNTGSTLNIQETNLPPNTTVYVRVWRGLANAGGSVTICQTASNNNSQIQPGETTVACGSTFTLYDSGGSTGNYGNNELTTWLLCPSTAGQYVSITFSSVNIAAGDQLVIIDGNDGADPVMNVANTTTSVTYTSSHESGCLMLIFRSDASTTAAGWLSNVTCSATPGNNTSRYLACNEQNCLGGCMRVLCDNNTVGFQGNGFGIQELNENNNGCMDTGERCTNWFYINPNSAGSLTMDMYVNNGQNQDFAIWEGYAPSLDCPSITGEQPIMCNIAPATNLGTGFNSNYSSFNNAYEDDLVITQQQIDDGIYLILMVQTFSNGNSCPQPNVQITFGGDVLLSCENPVEPPSNLPISLLNFNAVNMGRPNHIFWNTASERDNDFFTVEHSVDGIVWETIATVKGAGNSVTTNAYHYNHYDYKNAINYYRLKQTDFDGTTETFHIVSVDNRSDRHILRTVNMLGQEVNTNYKGVVIDQYSDGTSEKRYNY